MANFSLPAPVETEKSTFLHDRSNRPAAPATSRLQLGLRWSGFLAGLVLSVGFTAVLFSVRDSWENHREWLVTLIPVFVMAGVALGHLVVRKQVVPLAAGGAFLFLALIFAGADILLDNEPNPGDTARDVLSVFGGVSLGIASVAFIVALLWVELRNPTKAPTPEL